MSKDLNQCSFIGRLGNDPDVKVGNNGSYITKISIACGDDYTDKNTKQKVEQTEWIRVTAFGRLAEIMGEYLKKGSKVFVQGKMKTTKYTDAAGVEKYSTDIVASELQMLDSRGDNQGGQQQAQGYQQPQQAQPVQQAPQQQGSQTPSTDFDDDVPF